MKQSYRYIFAIFLFLISVVYVADAQVIGGTLIFGRGGDSVGLDPAQEEDGESFKVCENIYDRLVQYKDESTEIDPALAESWEASEDGLTWRFNLRRGVKFHDGTPFNADAVLFSLNRQHDPNHPFHNVGGSYTYWSYTGLAEIVEEITAPDAYTVEITLKRPYAPFIYTIAMTPFSIVSPTALQKWGVDFKNHPVGTGPFKFVRWDREDKVVLEANTDYWEGRPPLDRIIFRSIPDNSVRLIELQNGSIHAMEFPNPDDLSQIRADSQLRIIEQPGMNIGYLAMNLDKKPFDNLRCVSRSTTRLTSTRLLQNFIKVWAFPPKTPSHQRCGAMMTRLRSIPMIRQGRKRCSRRQVTQTVSRPRCGHYRCHVHTSPMEVPLPQPFNQICAMLGS